MSSPELPNGEQSFTESDVIEYIQKIIAMLKEIQGTSDYSTMTSLFEKLDHSFYDLEVHRNSIIKELTKRHCVAILSTYLNRFNKLGYFHSDEVWRSTIYSLSSLWNYSDASEEIANQILKTKLPKLLMENLLHQPYIQSLEDPNHNYLIKAVINIIHNIVRHRDNEKVFNKTEMKKVLVELVQKDDSDDIGVVSILILACLVDENQLDMLVDGEMTTKIIINKIRSAFENPSKRINGFSIWELVNGLRHISANDSMKKYIVREHGIELMFDIIKEPSCEEDIEKCLGVLWNLCFDKNIRSILLDDFNLRNAIKQFEHHKLPRIRKCYEGIIWLTDDVAGNKQLLQAAKLSKRRQSQVEYKFDVFISYSWANKSTLLSIRDELIKSNIRVWIDVDQMKGSTLEAMADGIENSNIFIIAISGPYNLSPNCRTEAEYAFALKKTIIPIVVEPKYKPTGWLGIILGSKTYYDFSGRRLFSESFHGLLNNIENNLGVVDESLAQSKTSLERSDAVDHAGITTNNAEARVGIYQWSNKDVENWLVQNGLSNFKSNFTGMDGKLLKSMMNMKSKAPDYLYATLQNEYGMKLLDILKLDEAFNELNL